MATEIIGFNKNNGEGGQLTSEELANRIDNLTEEDEDNDGIVLGMSDLSDLATAMAMVKAGLNMISEITQVEVSEEVVEDIATKIS